jgi:hypothetical protein
MLCEPAARDDVVQLAMPLAMAAEPRGVTPSTKLIVPVAEVETDAVKVTGFCTRTGFAEDVSVTTDVIGAVTGGTIAKASEDEPPPGPGFVTVTPAAPLAARAEAGTGTVSCVLLI